MEPIRSPQNRAVVEAGRLHRARDRHRSGRTLIEGPHLVAEALAAGVRLQQVFALADDPRRHEWPAVRLVDQAVMARLAGTDTPRGPVAVIDIPPWDELPPDDVLVLVDVGDPGNVGTIVRSAAAFGLGVAVAPGTADPWAPKVLRAGAGAHFRTTLTAVNVPADLKPHLLVATVVRGSQDPAALRADPCAFLIGSEARGLDEDWAGAADLSVTIPMPGGGGSLNASVAASIIAYLRGNRSGG